MTVFIYGIKYMSKFLPLKSLVFPLLQGLKTSPVTIS